MLNNALEDIKLALVKSMNETRKERNPEGILKPINTAPPQRVRKRVLPARPRVPDFVPPKSVERVFEFNVLIYSKSLSFRNSLAKLFERDKLKVGHFSLLDKAEEAIHKHESSPKLVFLDLNEEVNDGLDFIEIIQASYTGTLKPMPYFVLFLAEDAVWYVEEAKKITNVQPYLRENIESDSDFMKIVSDVQRKVRSEVYFVSKNITLTFLQDNVSLHLIGSLVSADESEAFINIFSVAAYSKRITNAWEVSIILYNCNELSPMIINGINIIHTKFNNALIYLKKDQVAIVEQLHSKNPDIPLNYL